ncbi:MAG: phage portal protein [Candidatus Anammoxibacter sp.]
MAKENFFTGILKRVRTNGEVKDPAKLQGLKNYIPITPTTRAKPYEGFTDQMLEYLCNNPIALNKQANWVNLYNNFYLMSCYESNPIVNAVINIKADAWANMRYLIKDLASEEIIPLSEYTADGSALQNLLFKPNPRENGVEWLKMYKTNYSVFGNSYVYASVPVGAESTFDYTRISVMNNLPGANVKPIITGKWLEATTMEEIIRFYELTNIDGSKTEIDTCKVWHTNEANIRLDVNFTQGVSKLVGLREPISNIAGAYETRNVMIYNRGALGFLSSEKVADGLGSVAMDDVEIKQVQEAMDKYGTVKGQYNHIVSPLPMKYVRMAMSVKDLMVFEEVESDAVAVSNAFGVPEILLKYYIKGATFENQAASERRFYDSTIIPETKDFMIGLNEFLKTKDKGIEILGSFDHVAALQTNKKDEAETDSKNGATRLKAFMSGAIVYNDYLKVLNLPEDTEFGELRVWDLDEDKRSAIGAGQVTITNTVNNGTQND